MALRDAAERHPLTAVLRTVGSDSCPGRLNFHCHSLCSDGSLAPQALADQACELALEHFAVTDHHGFSAHGPAAERLAERRARGEVVPTLWRGVEISCLLEGCLVHVLALGFSAQHEPLLPYLQGQAVTGPALQAAAVVEAIQASRGLALLAHPARYRLPHPRLIAAAAALGFDGAEAWYDYGMQGQWSPTPLICEEIAADLDRRGLLSSCGTDSHGFKLHAR
ncbi:MAG: PHP domain-containing protein [Synechococcaceae cyanobacterium]|nr:PHP domain-containing protein [Synechococcaceae cyanobacterium]